VEGADSRHLESVGCPLCDRNFRSGKQCTRGVSGALRCRAGQRIQQTNFGERQFDISTPILWRSTAGKQFS